METVMVGVLFLIGIACVITGIVALVRRLGDGDHGRVELPGGIVLEGTGAAILFLLVGAALMVTGCAWTRSSHAKTEAISSLRGEVSSVQAERDRTQQELTRSNRQVAMLSELNDRATSTAGLSDQKLQVAMAMLRPAQRERVVAVPPLGAEPLALPFAPAKPVTPLVGASAPR